MAINLSCFLVSAKSAQRAQSDPDPEQRCPSAQRQPTGRRLEQFVSATLDDTTRLQLKFNNPLGVAEHLVAQAGRSLSARRSPIEDKQTATALETVITETSAKLNNELPPRLAEVENILYRPNNEERLLRQHNPPDHVQNLVRGDKVRAEFEKQVLADVPQQN